MRDTEIPQLCHAISPPMFGFQLLFFAILFKCQLYSEMYYGCGGIGIDVLSLSLDDKPDMWGLELNLTTQNWSSFGENFRELYY